MSDPKVIAAVIAAIIGLISSLITVYWLKPKIDKKFHVFQLKENYKHEQAKKIKETIGKYKSLLLNSGELLNNRLKNFSKNHDKDWLNVYGEYSPKSHYIDTTVYRFISFFAYIKLVEDNLEYLDTTYSDNIDMEMIRYFRIFTDVITDVELFEEVEYDSFNQTDHFFRNRFGQYVETIIKDSKVLSFDQFEESKDVILKYIKPVYQFFDGMNPTEDRKRIERIKCFHCLLISFLNYFGYDFQHTDLYRIDELKTQLGPLEFVNGYKKIISKYKLKESKDNVEDILKLYK